LGRLTYIFLFAAVCVLPERAFTESHPIRPDALEILRSADSYRQQILTSRFDASRVIRVIERDREMSGLSALSSAQRTEISAIVSELNRGRDEAYRVLLEGQERIAEEIALAAQQAQARARFEESKRRNQLYLQLFQNIISVAGSFQTYSKQQRIQEFRGEPADAREEMASAYVERSPSSDMDFVTNDAGLPVEEMFNPLRGEPTDLDFFGKFPSTYQNCISESFEWYNQAFPTWEGRMPHADGLEGAQAGVQIGFFWDCGVLGLRSSRYIANPRN